MSLILAVSAVAQSVVLIASSFGGGSKTGTGFAISTTSTATRILTANHVVEGTNAPLVFTNGPLGGRVTSTIIRADRLRDVAILEIPVGNFPTVALADADPPISGTDIQAMGYPTLPTLPPPKPGATPAPSPSPLPLGSLKLATSVGKVDGVAEQGESVLLEMPLTHGDSGAPIVDVKSNRVVGMVLGLSSGYGVARWMSGDGLGLSVAAINAFMSQTFPAQTPAKPGYWVALQPNPNADVSASLSQLAQSAGFVVAQPGTTNPCRTAPTGPPSANAVIEEAGDTATLTIDVTDCSGAPFYRDGMTTYEGGVHNLIRLVDRTFLGYIDTHAAQWSSLLKFGIAVDPQSNPYLALMSVERNPFGQLIVAHVFHGGPADMAGIHEGDAVLKIDGRPTRALADLFIARLLNQPSVTLLLNRNEKEFSVRLQLQRFARLTANGPILH